MARPGYRSVVLVTGFPSFLAKRLVLHLLATEPHTLVMVVVPARLHTDARHVIDALDRPDRERVVVFEGDPSAIDLGLEGAELRQISREVDRIHHAAHASYAGVDRPTAEALNVVSAAEILEVATLVGGLKLLVFHSTALVSGDRRGTVYEEELAEGVSFRSVIDETRARAERLVRRAQPRLPIAVVRPTMIVGDSGTGEVERLDLPYVFVLFLLAAPNELAVTLPLRGDAPVHFVPVDFVVRAACAIGNDPSSAGRTFHLADPHPLPLRRFVELLHRLRERRASWMELSTFARSVLRAPGIESYLRTPLALIDQLTTHVRYDARNADALLGPLGITCPPLESYAERVVATVEERMMGRTSSLSDRSKAPPVSAGHSVPPGPPGAPHPEPAHEDTDAMD